ncbi:MAG: stage III sporulation AC/AD family protein [Clostridia bacterium]|nr:stage III sporulation AC/AD family protein [Clostridia bacterium]
MEGFISAIGALLFITASVAILKSFGFKGAPVIAALAFVHTSTLIPEALLPLTSLFESIEGVNGVSEYVRSAVKIVGIGYLGGICSDVCRELGEGGIAKCVTLVSRLELIAITLPILSELFSMLCEIVSFGQ